MSPIRTCNGVPRDNYPIKIARCQFAPSAIGNVGSAQAPLDTLAAALNGSSSGSAVLTADVLRAVPFVSPVRGGVVDAFILTINASASNNMRLAIYENMADDRDCYPGALLWDSGNISTTTGGIRRIGCQVALKPGRLYWLVFNGSVSLTINCSTTLGFVRQFLGMGQSDTTTVNTHITVSSAFGAMPSTFPAGGAYAQSNPPFLRLHFAA